MCADVTADNTTPITDPSWYDLLPPTLEHHVPSSTGSASAPPSALPVAVQVMRQANAPQQVMEAQQESVVQPWWEQYDPPVEAGVLQVDMQREFQKGLRPRTFSGRLKANGVSEMALKTVVALAQQADSDKVRLEAAKVLLAYAEGEPEAASKQHTQVTAIQIVVDI